ncbi:MAG: copper resistance protein B [Arenicella sp.]|nr:copper resistance protein B [Arenicella sp.]
MSVEGRVVQYAALMILLLVTAKPVLAASGDDPWLSKIMSEIELFRSEDETVMEWDIDAWMGRDLAKFWVKTSGEMEGSEVEEANIELVYSRAVSAYWDQQFGVRHDIKPDPGGDTRNWLSYGYIGTAPYFIEVDARLFVGEESSTQLLIELEREIMLTQRWVLTPELDITANGSSNEKYREGSGLSEVEFSIRLGYERSRKFQPFIALAARQAFGSTSDFAKQDGNDSSDIEALVGIHSWF